jgi:hypothetical protein
MKFLFLLTLICFICFNFLSGCIQNKPLTQAQYNCPFLNEESAKKYRTTSRFLIFNRRKWGYINPTGKIVIKPQFNYAENFFGERAAFKDSNGKFGYIDLNGKVIIPAQFEEANLFLEKRAAVKKNGKWGFINPEGFFILKPEFEEVTRFFEGRAAVRKDKEWNYIDLDGKLISQTEFFRASNFSEGLAAVVFQSQDEYQEGFIDYNGDLILKLKNFELDFSIFAAPRFTNGLSPVYRLSSFSLLNEIFTGEQEKKWGFIDKNGRKVVPLKYDSVSPSFSECLTSITLNGKKGLVNNLGKIILEPKYESIREFSEGLARIKVNQKYGYIDKTGRVIIEPQFYDATNFEEGLASVQISENGKWGSIDRTGRIVIKPQFDDSLYFTNGLAGAEDDKKFGYIDRTGKFVWFSYYSESENSKNSKEFSW